MKILILDEAIPGKKKQAYSPFRAIEIDDCSEEDIKFLSSIHGKDLTNPEPNSKEDLLAERYLNFIYDFSGEKAEPKYKFVIYTDVLQSKKILGPYDRVFHIMY